MLLLTSMESGRVAFKLVDGKDNLIISALISTSFNLAAGFIAGLLLYLALKRAIIKFLE